MCLCTSRHSLCIATGQLAALLPAQMDAAIWAMRERARHKGVRRGAIAVGHGKQSYLVRFAVNFSIAWPPTSRVKSMVSDDVTVPV